MSTPVPEDLHRLIADMDVPASRRTATGISDLRWLSRNLGIRNAGHSAYPRAMEVLKTLIRAA